jgi:general secretion pathway protein N
VSLRRRALLAFLFGCVFLIGLLVFAPASLMGSVLERATGGMLSLAQTSGSVWHGSGVALLRQKTHYQMLGSYRWNLQVFNAALQVQAGEYSPMTIRYVPFSGHLSIDNLHLTLPASALELAAPQLGPYQFQGSLDARCDHLALNTGGMNGLITIDWLRAASGLSEIRPLGDYRILLQGKGATVDAQLSTLAGKLQLAGKGTFGMAGGMQNFSGTAQAERGAAEADLNELLHHIGPEVSPGVFSLALMPQGAVR